MRRMLQLPAALALVAAPALAQNPDARPTPEPRIFTLRTEDANRAVIGVTTSAGVRARDTLGLIVTSITPNSPAERAGLEEGDRLQAVNGTTLRLSAGDTDDAEMRGIMQRRLERELRKVKPGDEVELRVYSSGRTRSVRVKTVSSDSLYPEERVRAASVFRVGRDRNEDRASLGISLGATGSRRDTLGVFVFAVNDSGPAAKAGIEEGSRIASVNNVDLRVSSADAGDEMVGQAKVRRLQREVERIKPGDEVTLRVYENGQYRTMKVKAVRASDLPRRGGSFFMTGDMMGPMPPMPPMPAIAPVPPLPRMRFDFDGPAFSERLQRSLDRALAGVDRAMVSLSSWEFN